MIDNNVKNQNALQKTANEIRVAFLLSLLTNLYDIYHFLNTSGEVRQGMSILVGVLGTGLLWQLSRELRAGKKLALYYWLGLLFVSTSRRVFLDAAFELSIVSIVVLTLAMAITLKMASWTRNRVLV